MAATARRLRCGRRRRAVRNLADAHKYIKSGPMASYAAHGFGLLLVETRKDRVPVGICGLLKRPTLDDVEVGYAFLPEHWSKGYAFEAASATLNDGQKTFILKRIVAITSLDNLASIRLLEKLGFEFEQILNLDPNDSEVKLFGINF